jgi:hypothetical protein
MVKRFRFQSVELQGGTDERAEMPDQRSIRRVEGYFHEIYFPDIFYAGFQFS